MGKPPFGLPVIAAPDQGTTSSGNAARTPLQALLGAFSPKGTRPQFSATTGRDGRFRIDGLPRDGIATASISGPGIERSQVYILTREMPAIRVKDSSIVDGPTIVYYGTRFDHVVAPTRPIVGTVRDKDTGTPIPGVRITGRPDLSNSRIVTPGVEAKTDAQGRYRLEGLPVANGFRLFTEAPAGQPYVNGGFAVPASESRTGPFPFDIALKRGVLVRGRLIDKATGRPLRGSVSYWAFRGNPHLDEYPYFKRDSQETRVLIPGDDGRFEIPALPGRGLITARVHRGGLPPRRRRRRHRGFRQDGDGVHHLSLHLLGGRPACPRGDQSAAGDEGDRHRVRMPIPAGP